jgi:hypothetical protein
VSTKQSTWRRAAAARSIRSETRAAPLASALTVAAFHANAQPQYMPVSSCGASRACTPNSRRKTSRPPCSMRRVKFSALPDLVLTRARNRHVLINLRARLIFARRRRVPFALAALRPLRRHARSVHSPTRRAHALQHRPRRIRDRIVQPVNGEAAHILRFIPEILVLRIGGGRSYHPLRQRLRTGEA